MESQYNYMVCTVCWTFNHHAYIEDAMNGFCMQKSDFPFVCIIIDDASTDGEQEVIKKYFAANFNLLETEETDDYFLNFGRHKTNENCYFVTLYLKYNHYSIEKDKHQYYSRWEKSAKYIALCEGDDYWIDENKLQRQVEALENHPECAISFCAVQRVSKTKNNLQDPIPPRNEIKKSLIDLEFFLKKAYGQGFWVFHTSSYLYRQSLSEGMRHSFNHEFKNFPYTDMPILLFCLLNGKGYYCQQSMSSYRVLSGGYNSYMLSHPEIAIRNIELVSLAIKDFNALTNGKYYGWIKYKLIRNKVAILKNQKRHLQRLKVEFWPLYFHGSKYDFHLLLNCFIDLFPRLYSFYKKFKK